MSGFPGSPAHTWAPECARLLSSPPPLPGPVHLCFLISFIFPPRPGSVELSPFPLPVRQHLSPAPALGGRGLRTCGLTPGRPRATLSPCPACSRSAVSWTFRVVIAGSGLPKTRQGRREDPPEPSRHTLTIDSLLLCMPSKAEDLSVKAKGLASPM